MVSFRLFPLWFPPPPPNPPPTTTQNNNAPASRNFSTAAAALSLGAISGTAGFLISQIQNHHPNNNNNNNNNNNPFLQYALTVGGPLWGCLSLSRAGMSFPALLPDSSQRLLGVGLRRKAVLGFKNVDVYAFGVYADDSDIKEFLGDKYGSLSASELKGNPRLREDLMDSDVSMTIRLQIVYGRLSIKSVRNAFQESVGSRLQKFGGSDNKDLLQRFTSLFKDDYKIPRGSVIDLSREPGYVLRTTIDGNEVGSIQSKLLCRSVLDLYIGSEPFDQKAKEDVEQNLASLLGK